MPDIVVIGLFPHALVEHVDLAVDDLDARGHCSVDLVAFGVSQIQVADPGPVDEVCAPGYSGVPAIMRRFGAYGFLIRLD